MARFLPVLLLLPALCAHAEMMDADRLLRFVDDYVEEASPADLSINGFTDYPDVFLFAYWWMRDYEPATPTPTFTATTTPTFTPTATPTVPPTPQVFFSDNFDAYMNTADMRSQGYSFQNNAQLLDAGDPMGTAATPVENAQWTLSSDGSSPNGHRPNPPDRRGQPTTGRFVLSDSDAAIATGTGDYGEGYAFTTPAFSCAGANAVYLHVSISALLNNNGSAVFEIWTRRNNGEPWQRTYLRVSPGRGWDWPAMYPNPANSDGTHGVLDLDLSQFLAGAPQARVRFVHRGMTNDWWVLLDDLLVDDQPYTGGSTTLLATEGFDAGIPAGWSVGSNNQDHPWNAADPSRHISVIGDHGGIVATGRGVNRLDAHYALLDSDANPDTARDDEWLDTPVVDCSSAESVWLHFDSELIPLGTQRVRVSLDGGATFEPVPVWTYDGVGYKYQDPLFTRHVIPVPEAAGHAAVVFRFQFEGDGNEWWWAIDNVRVTAR